jgi:anion-transporting  ArsA/GET3 family ATPase
MTPRLHVLLGSGGVGKTTLAVGYALALAQRGGRVGLLGIDPSRRLQDALGVALSDLDTPVPGAGLLRAAIVHPHQAIQRWVAQACTDRSAVGRLEANPLFSALGDRLATAIDILAAARIAEWAETDPALSDLVIDTAPGVAAVEFLRSPQHIEALAQGWMIRWLRTVARTGDGRFAGLRFGARRVLGGLASIVGTRMIADLADFFTQVRAPLERMLVRVERTERWLRSEHAELLLVTSPRDTNAAGAAQVAASLRSEHLPLRAVIVNRTLPAELVTELAVLEVPPRAERLVGYARAYASAQAGVLAAAARWAPTVLTLASQPALVESRRPALVDLGTALLDGLSPVAAELRIAS